LYKLAYEQTVSERTTVTENIGSVPQFSFPSPSLGLSFNDADLNGVKEAWKLVMGNETLDDEYMIFDDRDGADAEEDVFD
jgi:hypothetical protein